GGQANGGAAVHGGRGTVRAGPAQGRVRGRSLRRALGAGCRQQRGVARQLGGAAAAQAGLDRAEPVGLLAERAARAQRDPGDHRQRTARGAQDQSRRGAALSRLPRGRARLFPAHAHLSDHASRRHQARRLRAPSVHRQQPVQGDDRGQGHCARKNAQPRRAALHAARHGGRGRHHRRGVRRRSLALWDRAQSAHARGAGALSRGTIADQGAHSRRRSVRANLWAMTRWRTYLDRLIVLVVILAAWQVGSLLVGAYWLSSPGAVASRFLAQIWNGELIRQSGYTIEETLIGTLVGGVPAVLL